MSRCRVLSAFVAVVFAAAVLVSCQKPYHEAKERYVFVATNINLPYWQEAQAGFMDAARVLGVKAEFVGPTSYEPYEEVDTFRKVVAQRPDGICVSAARAELFKSAIDEAVSHGIPVICVDADVPNSRRVMFVGTDNARAGFESAKRMASLLHSQGRLAVITIPGQHNIDERLGGVNEAIRNYPGLQIAKIIDDKGDPRFAFDAVSEIIQKKEKIDGIICLEASGGSGAAEALNRFNMAGKIPIVAFDKDAETLDWIERGAVSATIAQKPYVMAYYGLKFLDDLRHNAVHEFKDWRNAPTSPLPHWVDTGTSVVDKNNLAAYREALAAHPKPL